MTDTHRMTAYDLTNALRALREKVSGNPCIRCHAPHFQRRGWALEPANLLCIDCHRAFMCAPGLWELFVQAGRINPELADHVLEDWANEPK